MARQHKTQSAEDPLKQGFVVNANTETRPINPAEIPTPVIAELRATGHDIREVRLAVKSDLGPDGQFGEQWLLIDRESLLVFDRPNGRAYQRHAFPQRHRGCQDRALRGQRPDPGDG